MNPIKIFKVNKEKDFKEFLQYLKGDVEKKMLALPGVKKANGEIISSPEQGEICQGIELLGIINWYLQDMSTKGAADKLKANFNYDMYFDKGKDKDGNIKDAFTKSIDIKKTRENLSKLNTSLFRDRYLVGYFGIAALMGSQTAILVVFGAYSSLPVIFIAPLALLLFSCYKKLDIVQIIYSNVSGHRAKHQKASILQSTLLMMACVLPFVVNSVAILPLVCLASVIAGLVILAYEVKALVFDSYNVGLMGLLKRPTFEFLKGSDEQAAQAEQAAMGLNVGLLIASMAGIIGGFYGLATLEGVQLLPVCTALQTIGVTLNPAIMFPIALAGVVLIGLIVELAGAYICSREGGGRDSIIVDYGDCTRAY